MKYNHPLFVKRLGITMTFKLVLRGGKKKRVEIDNLILINDDSFDLLKKGSENRLDCIITDPPYGLEFMGKKWDKYSSPLEFQKWNTEWAKEALRVLKPGGHMLVFGGTRTFHRMMCGIEDAGFELRDTIMWLYGSGFPKSYNIGQSIQKKLTTGRARRKDRDLGGLSRNRWGGQVNGKTGMTIDTGGAVELTQEEAIKYAGYGSALKPAFEPIIIFRKPLSEKNLADNVLRWGTGGINIDDCRVALSKNEGSRLLVQSNRRLKHNTYSPGLGGSKAIGSTKLGRWPANVIHDGSEEIKTKFSLFGNKKSGKGKNVRIRPSNGYMGNLGKAGSEQVVYVDEGFVSRFFYCAKAKKSEKYIKITEYVLKNNVPPTDLEKINKILGL